MSEDNFSNDFFNENNEDKQNDINVTGSDSASGVFSGSNYQDYTQDQSFVMEEDTVKTSDSPNGLQIASLVLGIIGILICCCYGLPSLILGIVGLVLGIFGNSKGKHGIGTAGFVCSIIATVLGGISTIYFVAFFSSVMSDGAQGYLDFMNSLYDL